MTTDTSVVFAMPSLGADMTEGRITEWLVQPGEKVTRGQIVVIVETEARALVTAPTPATIRFAGEVPSYGNVVILEPAPDEMVILAGVGDLLTERDDIVSEGDPIGLMPGVERAPDQKLIDSDVLGGHRRTETLYIEVRQDQAPVDPANRFRRDAQEG